jgi:uncharacterized membrane protein YgdD (TMEM256/DUF423 family)
MAAAALLVAVAMGVGALGAHALQTRLTAHQLGALETGVHYLIFNALGLFLVGLLMRVHPDVNWRGTAIVLTAGSIGFSGGIGIMLAGAPRAWGYVTPIGGVLMLVAWLSLAVQLYRMCRRH